MVNPPQPNPPRSRPQLATLGYRLPCDESQRGVLVCRPYPDRPSADDPHYRYGESAQMEFKRQLIAPDKLAREIGALANTAGGWLVLGVSDQGEILGLEDADLVPEQLQHICLDYLDPPVQAHSQVVQCQGRTVVGLWVPNSANKPHQIRGQGRWAGQVYLRHQSYSVPAGPQMIKLLLSRDESQIGTIPLERLEQAVVDSVQTQGQISLKQCCDGLNLSERRGQRILTQLIRAGVLNLFQQDREDRYGLNPLWLERVGRVQLGAPTKCHSCDWTDP